MSSEFELKDVEELIAEKSQSERELRQEYSKKGLDADFLGNRDWWEQIKAEDKHANQSFFGKDKVRRKYAAFLTGSSPAKEEAEGPRDPEDAQREQRVRRQMEQTHVLDDPDDSEDYTEDITGYLNEMRGDFEEAHGKGVEIEDPTYQMYQDKLRMKEAKRNYDRRSAEELFSETARIANSLGLDGDSERQLIFEKLSTDDYLNEMKAQHKMNQLFKALEEDEEEEEKIRELIWQQETEDRSRDLWLNKKANKK